MQATVHPTMALAERVSSADYEAVPAPAREVAKQAIMDFIGVTLAGSAEPLTRILREEAEEQGGHAQASIIGARKLRRTSM